jgi:MFS transporter, DHA2 family, multidrug resistance protein
MATTQEPIANRQSPTAAASAAWVPSVSPWLVAATVMLATFMEVLDTSIANVSLPHIAGSLSATVDESTWVLTSYLISNAIVLPLTGWLSMLFGRKRLFIGCVIIFTISSFLCGLAPNLPLLIFFRILQGAGGGGLQPISQAILVESFSRKKQGMAMAVYGMGIVVAPIIGPTLGGWITSFSSVKCIAISPETSLYCCLHSVAKVSCISSSAILDSSISIRCNTGQACLPI